MISLAPAAVALFATTVAAPHPGLVFHVHPGGDHLHIHDHDGDDDDDAPRAATRWPRS